MGNVVVKLNLAHKSNAVVLVDADNSTAAMTGSSRFSAAEIVAQVLATKTATNTLRAKMNAPTSDTKTDDIKVARGVLDFNYTKLGHQVEGVANDPSLPEDERVAVVHSAQMDEKNHSHPQKHKFTVNNILPFGTAHVTAEGEANAHEWDWTLDVVNLQDRVHADSTTKANTDIFVPNAKKGTEVAFFHKPIIAKKKTAWEGPIFLTLV